jgi:hypothetical protein
VRFIESINPCWRPNWPGDALDRKGAFCVAEPGRIIEKYERTPRPAMIRIGDADQMRSGPP